MGKKKRNIFAENHIFNGIMAVPFAFLMGGPAGVLSVLGLTKVMVDIENKEEAERQKNLELTREKTPEEKVDILIATLNNLDKEREIQLELTKEIDALMDENGAKDIFHFNICNEPRTEVNKKLTQVTIDISEPSDVLSVHWNKHPTMIKFIYEQDWFNPIKRTKAYVYSNCHIKEFLDELKENLDKHKDDIVLYKIKSIGFNQKICKSLDTFDWMYTIDNGKTYIACEGLWI